MKEIVTVDKDGNVISRTIEKPKTSGFTKFVTIVVGLFILGVIVSGIEHAGQTSNSLSGSDAGDATSGPDTSEATSVHASETAHKLAICLRGQAEKLGYLSEAEVDEANAMLAGCSADASAFCTQAPAGGTQGAQELCGKINAMMAVTILIASQGAPNDGNTSHELVTCMKAQIDTGHYTYKDGGKSALKLMAACDNQWKAQEDKLGCGSKEFGCNLTIAYMTQALLLAYDPSNPKQQAQEEPQQSGASSSNDNADQQTGDNAPTQPDETPKEQDQPNPDAATPPAQSVPNDLSTVTPSSDAALSNALQAALSAGTSEDWNSSTAALSGRVYVGQPQTVGYNRTCRSYGYTVIDGARTWKAPLQYACRTGTEGDWTLDVQF